GDVFSVFDSAYNDDPFCNQYYGGYPYDDLTVIQVDYIIIAGEERKVITFNEYGFYTNYQWIEGIGNITGFDLIWEVIDITGGSLLVCFTTGGETYFFNEATSCDNTTLGIADSFKEQIILYPNPVVQRSILQFPEELEINKVKIYTINGRLIRDKNVSKYLIIDNMNYASGLYFYQIFSNDKLIKTEKFIVK
ncbi:MAG: T9SS type A sorting domain-containing protein, partial [Flavobacteriaceae bacterium]